MDKEFLMGLEGVTEEMAEAILERHTRDLAQQQIRSAVAVAICAAGGRNQKAISALLDMQALEGAEDVDAAATAAVAQVKKDCGYLFAAAPGFAAGSGGREGALAEEPMSLAEALKEKFFQR